MVARLAMTFLMRGGFNELLASRSERDYKQPNWLVTIVIAYDNESQKSKAQRQLA